MPPEFVSHGTGIKTRMVRCSRGPSTWTVHASTTTSTRTPYHPQEWSDRRLAGEGLSSLEVAKALGLLSTERLHQPDAATGSCEHEYRSAVWYLCWQNRYPVKADCEYH